MKLPRKPEPDHIQGICVLCFKNKQTVQTKNKFRPICSGCHKARNPESLAKEKLRVKRRLTLKRRPYSAFKKDFCECCGFIAVHSCQLDVDHIDGNHENNEVSNLQTLCANCHRLKTQLNRDWE